VLGVSETAAEDVVEVSEVAGLWPEPVEAIRMITARVTSVVALLAARSALVARGLCRPVGARMGTCSGGRVS
jgi:hypothetical protein